MKVLPIACGPLTNRNSAPSFGKPFAADACVTNLASIVPEKLVPILEKADLTDRLVVNSLIAACHTQVPAQKANEIRRLLSLVVSGNHELMGQYTSALKDSNVAKFLIIS